MKHYGLVLLLAGWSIASAASPVPSTLIANVSGRTTINLDGAWPAIVDPFDNGKSSFFAMKSRVARASASNIASTRPP